MRAIVLILALAALATPDVARCRDCTRHTCFNECPGACTCVKRQGEQRGECFWFHAEGR